MEEEKKEVVEEQPVEEKPAEEPKAEGEKQPMDAGTKNALIAFILACCSFLFVWTPVVGLVCGIIALKFFKKTQGCEITAQPYATFQKITKILALVCLIINIVVTVVAVIGLFIAIISAIIGAIANAVTIVIL